MQSDPVQTNPLAGHHLPGDAVFWQSRTEGITDIRTSLALFTVLLVALAATSLYNYLLFHTISELVAIGIAIAVFTVAWNARTMRENGYLLVAGTGLLFVAGIGLVHTLAYKGMEIFVGYDANLPTQLWIASRYLLAGTLLAAPLLIRRGPGPWQVIAGFAGVTGALLLSLFVFPVFPDCFIEGQGLTPFKVGSEYVISALLILGAVAIYRLRDAFSPRVANHLVAAILVLVASELAFTLYVDVYGIANMVGHLLMVLAFGLFYVAFVETGIRQPYAVVFTDLARSKEQLQREKDRLSQYLDIAGALFVVLDRDGRVALINRRASRVLGYPADAAVGEPWVERFIPPAERERYRALFSGLMKGDAGAGEYVRMPVLTADGGERIIEWHNTVLRGEDDVACGALSSGEDITERQHAEEALARANAKLNLLSGVTRHDILNQITVARAYVDFAAEEIADSGTRDYLARARAAVEEIRKQVEFTRDYQDMGIAAPVWQKPADLIRESVQGLAPPVHVRVDLGDLEIYADPMVGKVFYNLIDNAIRHGGKATEIRFSYKRDGQDLLIFCEDDGAGIPEGEKEAIFYKTYKRRHGHGHGLFLVAGILGITGMTIRETGVFGEGARFEVRVPNGGWRGRCLSGSI